MVMSFANSREAALEIGGFHSEVQASALNLDGFTVRDDYMAMIGEYIRKNLVLWPLLPKEPAEADLVREIIEGPEPSAGFFDKTTMNPPENATNSPIPNDLSDTGQQIKAVGGVINIGHYSGYGNDSCKNVSRQPLKPYIPVLLRIHFLRRVNRFVVRLN